MNWIMLVGWFTLWEFPNTYTGLISNGALGVSIWPNFYIIVYKVDNWILYFIIVK